VIARRPHYFISANFIGNMFYCRIYFLAVLEFLFLDKTSIFIFLILGILAVFLFSENAPAVDL